MPVITPFGPPRHHARHLKRMPTLPWLPERPPGQLGSVGSFREQRRGATHPRRPTGATRKPGGGRPIGGRVARADLRTSGVLWRRAGPPAGRRRPCLTRQTLQPSELHELDTQPSTWGYSLAPAARCWSPGYCGAVSAAGVCASGTQTFDDQQALVNQTYGKRTPDSGPEQESGPWAACARPSAIPPRPAAHKVGPGSRRHVTASGAGPRENLRCQLMTGHGVPGRQVSGATPGISSDVNAWLKNTWP
jgi:hypothetical protein